MDVACLDPCPTYFYFQNKEVKGMEQLDFLKTKAGNWGLYFSFEMAASESLYF